MRFKIWEKLYNTEKFTVIQKGNKYFGIEIEGEELISTKTKSSAIRKARLLDRVYSIGRKEGYDEGCCDAEYFEEYDTLEDW